MILSMYKTDHLAAVGGWATQRVREAAEGQGNDAFVSFLLNDINDSLALDEVRKLLVITERGYKNMLLHKPSVHTKQLTFVILARVGG